MVTNVTAHHGLKLRTNGEPYMDITNLSDLEKNSKQQTDNTTWLKWGLLGEDNIDVLTNEKNGEANIKCLKVEKGETIYALIKQWKETEKFYSDDDQDKPEGERETTEKVIMTFLVMNKFSRDGKASTAFPKEGVVVVNTLPSRLHTLTGLKKGWEKERKVQEGDLVLIKYIGENKSIKGNPKEFELRFVDKK